MGNRLTRIFSASNDCIAGCKNSHVISIRQTSIIFVYVIKTIRSKLDAHSIFKVLFYSLIKFTTDSKQLKNILRIKIHFSFLIYIFQFLLDNISFVSTENSSFLSTQLNNLHNYCQRSEFLVPRYAHILI